MQQGAVLEMRGICKYFPGVRALQDVDFTLREGEIHALMGENGAGKSTLIKVLTGVYPKDGDVIVMGFDSDTWAMESVLNGSWNYMGLCNPLQAETVDGIIKDLMAGNAPSQKIIYTPEQGFDAATITQADVDTYGT